MGRAPGRKYGDGDSAGILNPENLRIERSVFPPPLTSCVPSGHNSSNGRYS